MRNDKRKARRRPLCYSAWMALENDKLHGCVLSDVSDTGARLDVEDSKALHDLFMLLLSGPGSTRRSCRVIWRSPGHVGVAFERRLADPAATTLAPKQDANAAAAKPDV
jgi:PilZ domain